MTTRVLVVIPICVLLLAHGVRAQENDPADWRRGTTLAVFAGAGSAGSGTGGAMGAEVGWELTPYLTFNGSGVWIQGRREDGFAALLGSRVNLTSRRTVVPFVSGGLGMYRASIGSAAVDAPAFYRRRMTTATGVQTRTTFEDFALSAGGGFDLYLQRHLALRPDVRVVFTRAHGETRPVAVYGIHLAYHFESRPITP